MHYKHEMSFSVSLLLLIVERTCRTSARGGGAFYRRNSAARSSGPALDIRPARATQVEHTRSRPVSTTGTSNSWLYIRPQNHLQSQRCDPKSFEFVHKTHGTLHMFNSHSSGRLMHVFPTFQGACPWTPLFC